ncbi:9218_t:CDS:1, partial [Racocetra fulgida]
KIIDNDPTVLENTSEEDLHRELEHGITHAYKNTREESPETKKKIKEIIVNAHRILIEETKYDNDSFKRKRNYALVYKGAVRGIYQGYLEEIVSKEELGDDEETVLEQFQEALILSRDEGERAA